jgi:hypothetical protein
MVVTAVLETVAERCEGSSPSRGTEMIQSVEWQAWRDVSQGYALRISSNTQLSNGV